MDHDPEHAKLDVMAARIRQAESNPAGPLPEANTPPMKMSRIGFDFLGAVLGGTIIGWLVDKYMPQLAPWGLIVMILLGFGAGIMNVWRALASSNQDR